MLEINPCMFSAVELFMRSTKCYLRNYFSVFCFETEDVNIKDAL